MVCESAGHILIIWTIIGLQLTVLEHTADIITMKKQTQICLN